MQTMTQKFIKQNFREGDRVIVHSLGDGKEYPGTICGKQEMIVCDNYIVKFDNRDYDENGDSLLNSVSCPIYEFSCLVLIESCIRRA